MRNVHPVLFGLSGQHHSHSGLRLLTSPHFTPPLGCDTARRRQHSADSNQVEAWERLSATDLWPHRVPRWVREDERGKQTPGFWLYIPITIWPFAFFVVVNLDRRTTTRCSVCLCPLLGRFIRNVFLLVCWWRSAEVQASEWTGKVILVAFCGSNLLLIYWDFHSLVSVQFTENGPKIKLAFVLCIPDCTIDFTVSLEKQLRAINLRSNWALCLQREFLSTKYQAWFVSRCSMSNGISSRLPVKLKTFWQGFVDAGVAHGQKPKPNYCHLSAKTISVKSNFSP